MSDAIEVQEQGRAVTFTFDEMLRYSGPGSPGGVALGFKVMERAFALLEPDGRVERREVLVETGFWGPGARDACELVTRSLTEGRYIVDASFARPDRGHTLETFAFQVAYRGRRVSLVVREGVITDEFVRLAQAGRHTPEEAERFVAMKQALADQLMGAPAADALDVE
jgi:hypothetical protein